MELKIKKSKKKGPQKSSKNNIKLLPQENCQSGSSDRTKINSICVNSTQKSPAQFTKFTDIDMETPLTWVKGIFPRKDFRVHKTVSVKVISQPVNLIFETNQFHTNSLS
jgi:hypothetical protein